MALSLPAYMQTESGIYRVLRNSCGVAAAISLSAMPFATSATPDSQTQLNFAETRSTAALSQVYDPGDAIQFTETVGGYTLLISADPDNLYGQSALGENPFLSPTVQVPNVGSTLQANPVRIGMAITGLSNPSGLRDRFQQPGHRHLSHSEFRELAHL